MKGCIKTECGKSAYFVNGVRVSKREFYNTFRPAKVTSALAHVGLTKKGQGWPKTSIVMGVHPKSVRAANERNIAAGVGVRYLENGRAVVPDRNEQKKLLKLRKMHNNDGGYGD